MNTFHEYKILSHETFASVEYIQIFADRSRKKIENILTTE